MTNRKFPFIFTQETIVLTQRAIELFDQPLRRADHGDEKVVFAEATMQSIKAKLEEMQRSVGLVCLVPFDYNEKILIRQAILLYSIELLDEPPGVKQKKELQQCRSISIGFTDEQTPTH